MSAFRHAAGAASLVEVSVDGRPMRLPAGEMLSTALLAAGVTRFNDSVSLGEARGPFCLMGSCFQCIAEVDGMPQVRTCRTPVRAGMIVRLTAPGNKS